MPGDLKKIITDQKGKKAKLKKLDTAPEGTKSIKLPKDVASELEQEFGAKLSKVRVHYGGNAPDMCKEVGAKAFVNGSDLFVMKASSAKDKDLIMHEMIHAFGSGGGKRLPKEQKGKVFVTK